MKKKNRDYRFDSAEIKIKLHSKGYFEVTFPAVRAYDEKGHFFKYQTLDGQDIMCSSYVKYFRFDEIMPSDQEREKIYNLIQDILPKDLMRKKRFNEKTMKGIIYYCQVCSKEIYPFEGAVICKECYNKHKKQVDAMLKKIREKVENEVQI